MRQRTSGPYARAALGSSIAAWTVRASGSALFTAARRSAVEVAATRHLGHPLLELLVGDVQRARGVLIVVLALLAHVEQKRALVGEPLRAPRVDDADAPQVLACVGYGIGKTADVVEADRRKLL